MTRRRRHPTFFPYTTLFRSRRRERSQVVARRTQMVVDDVENDADAERMRPLDEPPQIVGPAVQARRRKQIHTVVPPARSEEHTSELQSHSDLVCRLLLEKKN